MAQALKEKVLQVGLLEQEVRQLRLLLALQQALIPNSKPASADTPLQEEDEQGHQAEDHQVEDHHQEDLEVRVAIHLEHQDLPHQYPLSKLANNQSPEQPMSNPWEDYHKSFLETVFLQTTSSKK